VTGVLPAPHSCLVRFDQIEPMSALGHKQTFAVQKGMSALPPIATSIAHFSMSASAKSGHQVITTKTRQAVSVAFVASLSACRREAI
jgi:hypothetical protein